MFVQHPEAVCSRAGGTLVTTRPTIQNVFFVCLKQKQNFRATRPKRIKRLVEQRGAREKAREATDEGPVYQSRVLPGCMGIRQGPIPPGGCGRE